MCPVCDKEALFNNLAIDGFFFICNKAPPECTDVQFHEDGSWIPVMPTKPANCLLTTNLPPPKDVSTTKRPVEIVDLVSDSDTEDSWSLLPPKKKVYKSTNFEMLPEETQHSEEKRGQSFAPFALSLSKAKTLKILPHVPDKAFYFALYPNLLILKKRIVLELHRQL
ncbi:e3 SUMO-protein ligase PIAS1 [Trichonephila clavipes]|nr:e3 SUMO-protein ligase PIAS1 [Trichonephila clavipes]